MHEDCSINKLNYNDSHLTQEKNNFDLFFNMISIL